MNEREFFDKEHGTTRALGGRRLSDDQRNQLRELQHEACDDAPCFSCRLALDEEDV